MSMIITAYKMESSIRYFINQEIILLWEKYIPEDNKKGPEEHLKSMLNRTTIFLANYTQISRISILHDYN